MRLTVPQIEERLSYLAVNDVRNPEIYDLLKQLASICIFQNKYIYGYSDIESVCHDVAADTYMRILQGRTEVTRWMYYVERSIQLSYINNQRKVEHEVINTQETEETGKKVKPIVDEQAVMDMSASSAYSINKEFNRVKKSIFLDNIDSLIRQVLNNTKFKHGSKDWVSLYTSVTLSLYNNKLTYFRMSPEVKPYVRLVIVMLKKALLLSEFFTDEFEDTDNNKLPSLIFYDEQFFKDMERSKNA